MECNGLLPCRARCEALRLTNLFRGATTGLALGKVGKIGAVDPLAVETLDIEKVEPGRGGVETPLSVFRDDNVDILRNQDDLAVTLPLNSNGIVSCAGRCFVSSCELLFRVSSSGTPASGVDASIRIPLLNLFSEDNGRPAELRFRSREVGADSD